MKPQPTIAVHDVRATSMWYQTVLGLTSGHGGQEYEQLLSGGEMVLQLHHWDAHEHPLLGVPEAGRVGNGVVLWFHESAISRVYALAQRQGAEIVTPLARNPLANHREFWMRDPNGYVIVVAGDYGDI
jgi:catechol 2,3-dioxygenase-like lactoylglutathione lyase family enzyme